MITEIDEDNDGKISFREFLLIFHKVSSLELVQLLFCAIPLRKSALPCLM
jgi:hypothetical protein